MKLILITLLAFAGSCHAKDPYLRDPERGHGVYLLQLHQKVVDARAVLQSDLKKLEKIGDNDEDILNQTLKDGRKLNAAIWRYLNPEDEGKNPYE